MVYLSQKGIEYMHVIRARNVHNALPLGLAHLASCGVPAPSRAGDVLVAPGPVTTVYDNPTERVLFWLERDANPFFHLMEGLWMLAGRNDLAFPQSYVKHFSDFSDDGVTIHGAYGYRWRNHFGFDQIRRVIAYFARHPMGRRAVIAMWDPETDLREDEVGRDMPCNTQILFAVTYGRRDEPNRLNMTVINRSNDVIWGLYGANAVHMSMLQEYIAAQLGLAVGVMTTVSNNFHAYKAVFDKTYRGALRDAANVLLCPYGVDEVAPYPMVQNPKTWDRDLALFFEDPTSNGFDNSFFHKVAKPIYWAHVAAKRNAWVNALEIIEQCEAADWRVAAADWLRRHQTTWQAKRKRELKERLL